MLLTFKIEFLKVKSDLPIFYKVNQRVKTKIFMVEIH